MPKSAPQASFAPPMPITSQDLQAAIKGVALRNSKTATSPPSQLGLSSARVTRSQAAPVPQNGPLVPSLADLQAARAGTYLDNSLEQ